MRRIDRQVTDPSEITEIMSRCQVLRLAMNSDSAPYILPVNFGMEPDGMTLYIHGAMTGMKYDLMAKDNRVGFEMDCIHGPILEEEDHSCTMDYESVVGWGIAEEITDEITKRHGLKMLMAHYHSEDFPVDMTPLPRTRIFQIHVMERTGKRRRKWI